MSNLTLTIKLDNNKINLTKSISLAYDKTNLPKHAFNFKTTFPLFWTLKQKHYDFSSGTLTVEVIDYNLTLNTELLQKEPKYPINILKFEKLDWQKFEPLIYSYTLSQLKKSIFNYRDKLLDLNDGKSEDVKFLKRTAPNLFFNKQKPVEEEIELDIRVKYEEAKFDNSKISFSVLLKRYKIVKDLEIINPYLLAEFEYIKQYFIKRLGKSFQVKLKLKLLDNKIEEIFATSEDINNINESLINSIKESSILDLKHFIIKEESKILYNTTELSAENLSLMNVSAKDILEIFIKNATVKNVRQLEYLAKDKHNLNERVQYTIKPLFGFVFNENGDKICFIWELLNSHATYVWKSNRTESQPDLRKVVEQAIATIKKDGREVYKKYYKTIKNPNYDFRVIEHSSNNLTDDERFNEWKQKLEIFCS